MNKVFKNYFAIWIVLLVLFNIVAFVCTGMIETLSFSASFWVGYLFITLAFCGNLYCVHRVIKQDSAQKMFYNIPLIILSRNGLIASFIIGLICMAVPAVPYWIGIILCAIILAITIIAVISASTSADIVSAMDEKIKTQTLFIKLLTSDAENLILRAYDDNSKELCRKVYETVRYSDPMTHSALAEIESMITLKFNELKNAVIEKNDETIDLVANDVIVLVKERNNRCKVLK